jgi:hypothetical protein
MAEHRSSGFGRRITCILAVLITFVVRFHFYRGRNTQLSSRFLQSIIGCGRTAWQGSEKTCRVLWRYKWLAIPSCCSLLSPRSLGRHGVLFGISCAHYRCHLACWPLPTFERDPFTRPKNNSHRRGMSTDRISLCE